MAAGMLSALMVRVAAMYGDRRRHVTCHQQHRDAGLVRWLPRPPHRPERHGRATSSKARSNWFRCATADGMG